MSRRKGLLGQRLHRLSQGRLRRPAQAVHTIAIGGQLALLARFDRLGRTLPTADESAELASRVTMIVKAFERPRAVRRLVRTARVVFPGRIVIADDSRVPLTDLGAGVEVLQLPFNVGLSAGRNAALDEVETEYVFVTDDDTVFTAASDLVAMMDYLDGNPEVDIVAPQLVYLPWWYQIDTRSLRLLPGSAAPLRQAGEDIGGAHVVFKVQNVFLARTAAVGSIRWESRLRLVEHDDFFSRASGRLVSVQADAVRAYHARTPFNEFYMRHRNDTAESIAIADRLWEERRRAADAARDGQFDPE